jgi:hypothetical protein
MTLADDDEISSDNELLAQTAAISIGSAGSKEAPTPTNQHMWTPESEALVAAIHAPLGVKIEAVSIAANNPWVSTHSMGGSRPQSI